MNTLTQKQIENIATGFATVVDRISLTCPPARFSPTSTKRCRFVLAPGSDCEYEGRNRRNHYLRHEHEATGRGRETIFNHSISLSDLGGIMNPGQLLEQADRLSAPTAERPVHPIAEGAAVFHFLTEGADLFFGRAAVSTAWRIRVWHLESTTCAILHQRGGPNATAHHSASLPRTASSSFRLRLLCWFRQLRRMACPARRPASAAADLVTRRGRSRRNTAVPDRHGSLCRRSLSERCKCQALGHNTRLVPANVPHQTCERLMTLRGIGPIIASVALQCPNGRINQ
jgi:hypothetical protein